MEPSSTGRRRRLLPRRHYRVPANGRKRRPAGTMAMVSSTDFLRASERATAIATLNRQRHLTPSCGGFTPTAERTVGPARMIVGELDTQTRRLRHADRIERCRLLSVTRRTFAQAELSQCRFAFPLETGPLLGPSGPIDSKPRPLPLRDPTCWIQSNSPQLLALPGHAGR